MNTIKIGCEAYILRDNKLLLGLRNETAGKGTWAMPGGHLEWRERADECIVREVKEETNIDITTSDVTLLSVCDDFSGNFNASPDKHYVHLTFKVDIGNQEPELAEPDMCAEWKWFPVDQLPPKIFPPHQVIFTTIASGNIYNRLQ